MTSQLSLNLGIFRTDYGSQMGKDWQLMLASVWPSLLEVPVRFNNPCFEFFPFPFHVALNGFKYP